MMKYILEELKKEISEFHLYEEFDNLLYVDFGRLGLYINKLTVELLEFEKIEHTSILKKVFDFLNKKFDLQNKEIINLIDVSIFESLIETRYGYDIAKKYMSKEMLEYFYKKYSYEEYKNTWDADNYYSEEEYQRIINLPSPEEE